MSEQHYFVPDIPVTMEDDADWIKRISRKFKKQEIVEKLETIGVEEFNPKASKKALVETLLYNLRDQIDERVDEQDDHEEEEEDHDGEDEEGEEEDDGQEEDDGPYNPTEDPSYRSELDGELDGDLEQEPDQEEEDNEQDEDDDTFVARMQKRFGLTSSRSKYFIAEWTDPTLLFCASTLMSVLFVRGHSDTKTLELVPFNEYGAQLQKHFVDPAWVAGGLFLYLAYYLTSAAVSDRFSKTQRMEAGWYLWNGAIIHVMMDGMAGGGWFKDTKAGPGGWGLKLMNENYQILDKRFARTGTEGDMAVATTITQTELIVHSTLCLYAYIGICTRTRWADAVGLIALSFQMFGAIMFIVPDLLTGCPNMQPFDELTCTPGFSWFELFYFWFGVVVNFVWVIVPLAMMKNIIQRQ